MIIGKKRGRCEIIFPIVLFCLLLVEIVTNYDTYITYCRLAFGTNLFGYDRTGEHEVFLNWLAEEIRQKEIDALIIAGDVLMFPTLPLHPKACIISLFIG